MNKRKLSKTMSYILRHHPEDFNLELNLDGTVKLTNLVNNLSSKFKDISKKDIIEVVENDKKGRFSLLENNKKIRANYGHSIENINLDYKSVVPPATLYHGTKREIKNKILNEGIKPMNRKYTHLSVTEKEAIKVGRRRDNKPIVFKINAKKAYKDGLDYYKTGKNIYLTDWVPPEYIYI